MKEIMKWADMYAANYDERHRKVARLAFLAGLIFRDALSKNEIDADEVSSDLMNHIDDGIREAVAEEEKSEELVIYEMCPYCEQEVELYSTRMQSCPNCGCHFQPSDEAIEASQMEGKDMNNDLIEFANLVATMRDAQKEFSRLRYSSRHDKRADAGERMADLQRTVDSELREILELED